jgi:hypothetical protein
VRLRLVLVDPFGDRRRLVGVLRRNRGPRHFRPIRKKRARKTRQAPRSGRGPLHRHGGKSRA